MATEMSMREVLHVLEYLADRSGHWFSIREIDLSTPVGESDYLTIFNRLIKPTVSSHPKTESPDA